MTIPRVLESGIAAAVAASVVAVIAWRIEADVVLLPAAAFLFVFLATLWRTRAPAGTSRPRARARRSR